MRKLTFTRVSGFRRLYETKLRMDMLVAGVLVGGMWGSALVPVVVKADSTTKVADTTTTVVADTTTPDDSEEEGASNPYAAFIQAANNQVELTRDFFRETSLFGSAFVIVMTFMTIDLNDR